jgi:hypothetical protein
VAFSPDAKYLAAASVDTFARVWKWADGKEIARMRHDDFVEAVTLSPDPEGRYLATASDDGTVRINYWRPDDLIAQARARLARNLTYREWQEHFGEEPYHKTCPDLPIDPGFVQAGRDLAKRGDFEGALAIFHRAVQLEPGLALDPEAEVQRITAAQTTAK